MIPKPTHEDDKDVRKPDGEVLTSRALLLLIVAAGIGLLWVHNPRWGAASLAGITVLALLAKMIS